MKYWLMKSEPEEFSISDLEKDRSTLWTGVRNYQARNFMMKDMKVQDQVLFYHSNSTPPGIAGIARVCHLALPDPLQFDSQSEYFDPTSSEDAPRWHCVQIQFEKKFEKLIPLELLRRQPSLKGMALLQKGQRLSVQPVTEKEFTYILNLSTKL